MTVWKNPGFSLWNFEYLSFVWRMEKVMASLWVRWWWCCCCCSVCCSECSLSESAKCTGSLIFSSVEFLCCCPGWCCLSPSVLSTFVENGSSTSPLSLPAALFSSADSNSSGELVFTFSVESWNRNPFFFCFFPDFGSWSRLLAANIYKRWTSFKLSNKK